jgi:hypothetical protein
MELIPGVAFDFGGGRVFTLAPLSLGTVERLQQPLMALGELEALNPVSIKTIIDAAHASLRRNYPATTREEVAELIDVGNMFEVITSVLDVSGIKRKVQADAEAAAKNLAAQPTLTEPTGLA